MGLKILAVETATQACSAALLIDDKVIERYVEIPRQHAQLILPMIDELLSEAGMNLTQLDGFAFGRGPGSFTGVRISCSVIQGLALAHDTPVVPVSTLCALAQGAYRIHRAELVLVALDARMQQVYWGVFQKQAGSMQSLQAEQVCAPSAIIYPAEQDVWWTVGSGWRVYHQELASQIKADLRPVQAPCYPHAQDIATLAKVQWQQGGAVSAEQAVPVYLRDNVVG